MNENDDLLLNANDVLENNKKVSEKISLIKKEIADKYNEVSKLRKDIIAPCTFCKYDGVYRCEACSENYYEGYNVSDYPRLDNVDDD